MGRNKKFRIRRKKFVIGTANGKKKTSLSVPPPPPPPPPPWTELPRDVTANILHRLGAIEILESAQKVCMTWRSVCKDPAMWRVIDMRNLGDLHDMPYNLETMCRHAVDRSQGQLTDINIEYFGTDELLLYIGECSSQLKRLRLACCYDVSGEGMREAVKKFPQLEELHLFFMSSLCDEDIEAIGHSCPLLSSFTYNVRACRNLLPEEGEMYAMAVGKKMPNLRHLRLFGNNMTNEGLQAILDGCPHLESLDLRQCFNVNLGGDLGKRCSKQIKHLRCPHDSTDDYEWDAGVYDFGSFSDPLYSPEYSDEAFSVGDYEYDYEDYTDPFGDEYLPHHHTWFFDRLSPPDLDYDNFGYFD